MRRASKEFQEVQLAAAVKSVTVEKELEKAENEAEAQGMAAPKAVSDAAARGAAKAAATKAEGFFIPRSEYLSLQSRLNSVRLQEPHAEVANRTREPHPPLICDLPSPPPPPPPPGCCLPLSVMREIA